MVSLISSMPPYIEIAPATLIAEFIVTSEVFVDLPIVKPVKVEASVKALEVKVLPKLAALDSIVNVPVPLT